MTELNIIDISVKDYTCPQHKLVPDELQNCHSHYRWDREMWTLAYHHGYREPRYPVPAIPSGVWYGSYHCMLFNSITGDLIQHWEYE